jgi:cytochrome c oxidase assembly factor CtaG
VSALSQALDWHLDLFWTLAIPAVLVLYVAATRSAASRASRRERISFGCGLVALLAAFMWPLDDLAAHWLLAALVVQRLLLMLAAPPLLVRGTPKAVLARLTRPAPVDAVLRVIVKPVPAVCIVTVIAVGTLTTGAVELAGRSAVARVAMQLLVLLAGFVLWAPVLTELPGTLPLSPFGRGGYLIVQSIVPSFLCIVWIFARRALYTTYNHPGKVFGLSPVLDQQLSGFVAKLTTIVVLWAVAFTIMMRAQMHADTGQDADPLLWSDVEREIERAERRSQRTPPEAAKPGSGQPQSGQPESGRPESGQPPENA